MDRRDLKILILDENPERAAVLEDALAEGGYAQVMTLRSLTNLAARVHSLAPDVIVIDLDNPDRDTLEGVFAVSKEVQRPIAMFVDQCDRDMIGKAVEAGVAAYVVGGLARERVQPVVDMAISRFQAFETLRRERDEAVSRLADRKVIERAKGLLMQHKSLSEQDAYTLLRRAAMQQNRKLAEIAQSVVTAYSLEL